MEEAAGARQRGKGLTPSKAIANFTAYQIDNFGDNQTAMNSPLRVHHKAFKL
jgi:hypothetical protein